MKKQLPVKKLVAQEVNRQLQANSDLSRVPFGRGSSNLGWELTGFYHGADRKRDVWTVAGYPNELEFDNHWAMFRRHGIAKSVVELKVHKTWQDFPEITDGKKEPGDESKTQFEKDVEYLISKKKLFHRLRALDLRQRVGRYGGLMIIGKEFNKKDPGDPAKFMGVKSIVQFKPVYESQLIVNPSYIIDDISDPRFGNPTQYEFKSYVSGTRSPLEQRTTNLHWSRAFAWGEGADDGTIFGIPCLEGCFNALLDLEKIRAAAAEGHYKNAKQRTVYNVNDSQVASALQGNAKEAFDEAQEAFTRDFDSAMTTYGMDVQTLQATIADPTQPFTISLNEIASSEGYPSTILIGQQTGRLASDEDQTHFGQLINARRENDTTDMIIGFLEHLIDVGALTPPDNEIVVTWKDVTEPTASDKLALGGQMADINVKSYQSGGAGAVFTDDQIREVTGYEPEDLQPESDDAYAEGDIDGDGVEQE